MENREKTVKLLESFLSDKQVDGVCGYIVDPDGEGPIQVIVVLDIDYIKEANTKPGFIARMIRQGVKQEIEKWIGFDVYVGSTAKKCEEDVKESKKTYVVTESQYKNLLEGSTEEESIEDSKRFYKMFKRIIDEKFSELTYDESPRWSTHEDDVAWKDSDEDVFRYNDYAFLVKRGFFWSLMNYLPISHNATKMMFERYFKEKFPDKFFLSVEEFDA
jgi:hypothetical protein